MKTYKYYSVAPLIICYNLDISREFNWGTSWYNPSPGMENDGMAIHKPTPGSNKYEDGSGLQLEVSDTGAKIGAALHHRTASAVRLGWAVS